MGLITGFAVGMAFDWRMKRAFVCTVYPGGNRYLRER